MGRATSSYSLPTYFGNMSQVGGLAILRIYATNFDLFSTVQACCASEVLCTCDGLYFPLRGGVVSNLRYLWCLSLDQEAYEYLDIYIVMLPSSVQTFVVRDIHSDTGVIRLDPTRVLPDTFK
jgi:hypothetical protein